MENVSLFDYCRDAHWDESFNTMIYGSILPILTAFGVAGNLLTIIVFNNHRLRSCVGPVELVTIRLLLALAASDMSFCIAIIPQAFLPATRDGVMVYYTIYHEAVINFFIFSSTWLVMILTLHRVLVIGRRSWTPQPRRQHSGICTLAVIGTIFLISTTINFPLLFALQVTPVADPCDEWNTTIYYVHVNEDWFVVYL